MHELDDATLLDALRQRDPAAFEVFFTRYVDHVYGLAFRLVQNEQDAEEIAQMTFLAAFGAIDRFEPRARISTWLYRIAYTHALMFLRRRFSVEPLPEEDGALPMPTALMDWTALPEVETLRAEEREVVQDAIAHLPPLLRGAFVLRDIEGLSTVECAEVQGITESACKARLHRARLALRELLSAYFAERLVKGSGSDDV
jgi:RNA polymerase sigma-70 factor, ECF subfamily